MDTEFKETKDLKEAPSFEVIGKLEDLAFGGGSDIDDGYHQWNPKGCCACC